MRNVFALIVVIFGCMASFINSGCCGCVCGVGGEERISKPPPAPEGLEPGAPPKAKADPDVPATPQHSQPPGT